MRAEYRELSSEFWRIARAFGNDVDPARVRDLDVLTSAIDAIDRHVDGTADGGARRRIWETLAARLEGGECSSSKAGESAALPAELDTCMQALSEVGRRNALNRRLARILRAERRASETLRTTPCESRFVRAVVREGLLTACPALLVGIPACSGGREGPAAQFRAFFLSLAGPANLVEKILDLS
jgi:hypothetical protein